MIIQLTIHTDNGADVTVERSRYEGTALGGPEVDLRALDTLLATVTSEARLAYGLDIAKAARRAEGAQGASGEGDV